MNIADILEAHGMWLRGKDGGVRVDFHRANLRGADLRGADLRWANLREADLREADLREADLRKANLGETRVLTFQGPRHSAICTGERLTIGCEDRCLADWADSYYIVGRKNGYSESDILFYENFINLCIERAANDGEAN